jgi:hypothetical protein
MGLIRYRLGAVFLVVPFTGLLGWYATGCDSQLDLGNPTIHVELSSIARIASPCETGYAHPNVCCEASASQTASCGHSVDAPFQQCAAGLSTYPDPSTCCAIPTGQALLNPTACSPPPTSSSPPPAPLTTCTYPCPPGTYSDPSAGPGACCIGGSDGGDCFGPAGCYLEINEAGSPIYTNGDAGSACTPRVICGTCPAGWQVPANEPDLCCAWASNGITSCFSQAVDSTGGSSSASADGSAPLDAGP